MHRIDQAKQRRKGSSLETEELSGPKLSGVRILLASSLFAPEIGGACAVAEALAANLPDRLVVVAPKMQPRSLCIEDWEAYDRRFVFTVHRVAELETELSRMLPGAVRGILQFGYNYLWTRRRVAASLRRFLASHPVEVLCINTLASYWLAAAVKQHDPKVKVIFYLHGEEVAGGPVVRRIDRYKHKALRAADAVVAVSSFTRDRALRCGVREVRLHIIHNGVDTARFTPGLKDEIIERRFGLTGKKVLLCLARLDERKGQDMLLAAMPAILAAVPETVLLIVGGGAEEGRLRGLTTTLGLQESVVFAGVAAESEVAAYYRTADVYAMPNRETASGDTEGFGLVFLEAGACAKPVVGGRAGGVPDAVIDGETGYLVDGRSAEEIADACIRLLDDPELAVRLGRNGLEHSSRNTWKAQAGRFLDLCEGLCHSSEVSPKEGR